jgi:hypothetical protein
MPLAELEDLTIQLRAHAKNEPFGIRRNMMRAAADAIDELLTRDHSVSELSEGSMEYAAVRQFLLSRKVNLMGWQWQRLEGAATMREEPATGEWVKL